MGELKAICTSSRKGEKKTPLKKARFVTNWGIEGDAHGGDWHRQISILAVKDIERMKEKGKIDLQDGDFGENLIISDIEFKNLGVGSKISIGKDVELTITQLGKECHNRCSIFYSIGECIMPTKGLFAVINNGGDVKVGDDVRVLKSVDKNCFQAAVLTISDRCSKGEAEDTAGPACCELLKSKLGANIFETKIIADERQWITKELIRLSDIKIDIILAVGGTGFSPRDVTPEAVKAVIARPTPGLDEVMRATSLKKTPHAMLSRSVSGICKSSLILSLPGSLRASTENLEAILPALGHGIKKLRGDPSDCGRPLKEEA